MQLYFSRWLGAIALVLGLTASAQAGTITLYDNLAQSTAGSLSVADPGFGGSGPAYSSFSTGATAINLTDVTVRLYADNYDVGGVSVNLFSDSGTFPGSQLAHIGSVSDQTIFNATAGTPADAAADFVFTTSFLLATNTRYWIQVGQDGAAFTYASWAYTDNTDGTGVTDEYRVMPPFGFAIPNTGFGVPTSNIMGVTGDAAVVAATPLPGALPMFAGGAAVLGLLMRRRRSRAAP
jgi:hypothetical protein